MARWRLFTLISTLVLILTGSGFAENNLVADSPWACFFNYRIEKVIPETGELFVKEDGELVSKFTYNGEPVSDPAEGFSYETGKVVIHYPTGARSEYDFKNGKVANQSLYDAAGNLIVANTYHYTDSVITIQASDAKRSRRRIALGINEGKVNWKEIYDLDYSYYDPIEKWQLYGDSLEIVERVQYLGETDAYFEATDWDQLLLTFYTPTQAAKKAKQTEVSFEGDNVAVITYSEGLTNQVLRKEFDSLGRLVKLSTEDTAATFEYNWLGLLSKLTIISEGKEEQHSYTYDASGREKPQSVARRFKVDYEYYEGKLKKIDSANGIVSYDYPTDNTMVRTDSLSRRTDYTFDPEKLQLAANFYDKNSVSSVSIQYTADGKRISMLDESGKTFYEYDAYGRLTTLTRQMDGESFELVHSYSPAGWLSAIKTPNNEQIAISAGENILVQAKQLIVESVWPWFN